MITCPYTYFTKFRVLLGFCMLFLFGRSIISDSLWPYGLYTCIGSVSKNRSLEAQVEGRRAFAQTLGPDRGEPEVRKSRPRELEERAGVKFHRVWQVFRTRYPTDTGNSPLSESPWTRLWGRSHTSFVQVDWVLKAGQGLVSQNWAPSRNTWLEERTRTKSWSVCRTMETLRSDWASGGDKRLPQLLYRNGRNSSHNPPLVSIESNGTSISFLKRNVLPGWRGTLRSHTSMIFWNHFCISPISSVHSPSVGRNFFLPF